MAGKTVSPTFVPIQKHRAPGADEKACPPCSGTGRVDSHVCKTCHGSGVVPESWKQGDGPVGSKGQQAKGTPAK